jgi:hypothetical protein
MQAITLSAIERTHGLLMYGWPIQSRRQLLSATAFVGGGLLVMALILYCVGAPPTYFRAAMFGGAIGGIYCGIYRVLPARMTLATRGEARHFVAELKPLILALGYRHSDEPAEAGRLHFCNKAPRWMSWDEQDLDMRVGAHDIVLAGPVVSLELLRARLLREMEA